MDDPYMEISRGSPEHPSVKRQGRASLDQTEALLCVSHANTTDESTGGHLGMASLPHVFSPVFTWPVVLMMIAIALFAILMSAISVHPIPIGNSLIQGSSGQLSKLSADATAGSPELPDVRTLTAPAAQVSGSPASGKPHSRNTWEIRVTKPFHLAALSHPGQYAAILISEDGCIPCDLEWDDMASLLKGSDKICAVKVNITAILQRIQAGAGKYTLEDLAFYSAIAHDGGRVSFPTMLAYNPVGILITQAEAEDRTTLSKQNGVFSGSSECKALMATVIKHAGNIPHDLQLSDGTKEALQMLEK